MKQNISELGGLCKIAAALERKWDRGGKDYLETRLTGDEYTKLVEEYLGSVRRLEAALTHHLVAVTAEIAQARLIEVPKPDERDHLNPAR